MKYVIRAIRTLVVMTILIGVIYPLAMTVAAQVIFPAQANGSLETKDGVIIGSSLFGQTNSDPRYFWPRPSAVNYMEGTTSSGAANLGPTSAALQAQAAERAAAFREGNGLTADAVVPPDMLFASGSGLDPHISPEAARLQIDRVAAERGLDRQQVADLVEQYVEAPQLGFLGQPRVNVLLLNLALDALQ